MSYDTWAVLFLGMVFAMLLYNVVQWSLYRERVYGLYTVYMLVWLSYFTLRDPSNGLVLPASTWDFIRVIGPMAAYIVYFEFTTVFLELRTHKPGLVRLFRIARLSLLFYIGVEYVFCFLSDYYQRPIHEIVHTLVRAGLVVLSAYTIPAIYRRREVVTRFFITGSLLLVVGGLTAMLLTLFLPDNGLAVVPFWRAPLTYLQIGISLELLFFSLGLTYRQRREVIGKALLDKEMARELEQRRREQAEAELVVQQLKQQVTEVQMRALQSQISPHFLFNSLNSLSSLIADEPAKAEQFVDELSNVYRYLLRAGDRELIPIKTEITFIQSYYHLLKTRYGQGLRLEMAIDPPYLYYLIPPLTLQLLVENAVKHNVVSAEMPLVLQFYTDNTGALFIRNNLQRKLKNRVMSTQKGLLNITEKYRLLNQPDIRIYETDDSFEVVIQLIKPSSTSNPNSEGS